MRSTMTLGITAVAAGAAAALAASPRALCADRGTGRTAPPSIDTRRVARQTYRLVRRSSAWAATEQRLAPGAQKFGRTSLREQLATVLHAGLTNRRQQEESGRTDYGLNNLAAALANPSRQLTVDVVVPPSGCMNVVLADGRYHFYRKAAGEPATFWDSRLLFAEPVGERRQVEGTHSTRRRALTGRLLGNPGLPTSGHGHAVAPARPACGLTPGRTQAFSAANW